ncbi:uncharacterized protein A1O9_09461 [Exophiala aquamarina CBS 119918]|uniref:RING-type E3 ubiquitin transferase n=1 Tax=Exophiala aquamarina CBS 119918 TaxID=1182545 RepID=A0A072PFJ8_9EURO|nr:uncharacterized protein A1O9_09461 [Exophiala aquamarina CBS 119918]KEF54295.1 hypothetical protein A1O9_09461 [Exophiala aquamarina CBS 119918]
MSAAQSVFDASQLLHDGDCDIMDEYNTVVEGALDMRRKFASIVSQARRLKTELLAKQAEVDHLTTRHEQDLSDLQHSAEVTRHQLRTQGHTLRRCKEANKVLRSRNQELVGELETARKYLDQVDNLRCNICTVSIKNVVTKCGHGFCRPCLTEWLRTPMNTCPICRQIVKRPDIRSIYLDDDKRAAAVIEDDAATEILSRVHRVEYSGFSVDVGGTTWKILQLEKQKRKGLVTL